MDLTPYRRVLSLPGVRALVLVGFVARIPATAVGLALTLHVVNTLQHSYGAAGLVTAGYTVGSAISAPLLGRVVDRRGARLVLGVTTLTQTACWLVAPTLSYPALLVVAVLAGLLGVPVWGLLRQSLSVQVSAGQHRPAFALDSMAVELSFMIGPAAAVALATTLSTGLTITLLGAATFLVGGVLFVMNPPVVPAGAGAPVAAPPRRSWLRAPLIATLVAMCAATFVLSGSDLTIVATLRESHEMSMTGVVIPFWCACSLVGGLIYGALHRSVPVLGMVAAAGVLTIPVGLAPNWQLLCLALLPGALLCAPTIAAGNDRLSGLVPAASRGEAMGLFSSALTAGTSLGAPFAGLVIDAAGPRWAFAASGAVGALVIAAVYPIYRGRRAPLAPADLVRPQLALSGMHADAD